MKTRSFEVQAKLAVVASITISAPSLEEALEKSKTLDETDFITIHGDCLDSDFRVTGVYETNWPLESKQTHGS